MLSIYAMHRSPSLLNYLPVHFHLHLPPFHCDAVHVCLQNPTRGYLLRATVTATHLHTAATKHVEVCCHQNVHVTLNDWHDHIQHYINVFFIYFYDFWYIVIEIRDKKETVWNQLALYVFGFVGKLWFQRRHLKEEMHQ